MNGTVAAIVSDAVTDMIEVSTLNGRVLESGVAFSLLQVGKISMIHHTQTSTMGRVSFELIFSFQAT